MGLGLSSCLSVIRLLLCEKKCTHLLRDFKLGLTTQSARALPASNWDEFLISENFIRVSAQNCHSEIATQSSSSRCKHPSLSLL